MLLLFSSLSVFHLFVSPSLHDSTYFSSPLPLCESASSSLGLRLFLYLRPPCPLAVRLQPTVYVFTITPPLYGLETTGRTRPSPRPLLTHRWVIFQYPTPDLNQGWMPVAPTLKVSCDTSPLWLARCATGTGRLTLLFLDFSFTGNWSWK